jgi:hypothetical protein
MQNISQFTDIFLEELLICYYYDYHIIMILSPVNHLNLDLYSPADNQNFVSDKTANTVSSVKSNLREVKMSV